MTDAEDDSYKSLTKKLDRLQELYPSVVQEKLSAESFIDLNGDVITTCLQAVDAEIVVQLLDSNYEIDDDLLGNAI